MLSYAAGEYERNMTPGQFVYSLRRSAVASPEARMPFFIGRFAGLALAAVSANICLAQSVPTTAGETLSGKPIVLADAVHGHSAVLVAGFSREGGNGAGDWAKAIHADPALAHTTVFQISMLAGAPGFIRGMIKSGIKKGVPPADQDRFVVLTTDEQPWKSYFGVTTENDAYVALIDAQGKILWHAHGPAGQLETQLRAALR